MSLDPDSPSTTNRDWIFPSQSFNLPRTPARRFSSSYPRTTSFQNSLSHPPSNSTPPAVPRTLRRRISHLHRIVERESSVDAVTDGKSNDFAVQSEDSPSSGNETTSVYKKFTSFFRRFTVSRQAACIIAILVMCFACLVHKNFSLHNQVNDLQGSLLNQLAIANESLGGGTVVVMAERDKEEMELDIAKMEFDFRGTSVICRSGSPLILADLKKVSVSKARAIVVLAEDGNADQSDARALRTVLSLTGVKEGLRGHLVVELGDLDNEVLVKLVGGDLVETVVAHDVIGRLMIQCARQPGLAQIWEDILGFENCEFYIKKWPQLHGMQFEEVLISFPDAIPCGIKVASSGGKIILNPDDSYVLQEGDEVLVIAEDDDSYAPAALPMVKEASLMHIVRPTRKPQKILLTGWRRDIDDMIVVSLNQSS
ncbi:hypothetical protein AABB24_025924 [Solanum stoloniferum]|uniref:RCK N-terminal domain-containing protein n=1 Tax=Solanum stoloniferum TaxID=62892 RepID=A0ABD2SC91_9SOLN